MILLEKILSKKAIAIIDAFRFQRGIRTRRQAFELLIQENTPGFTSHELPMPSSKN
ncbi:MAG: hypothetical protein RLZZ156_277 [Deinococcota bacterium]|jgi:hypothetical protein